MKPLLFFAFAIFLSTCVYSQNKYFTIKKIDGNKSHKIRVNAWINIENYKLVNDTLKKVDFVEGWIDEISNDSILIDISYTGDKLALADKSSLYTYHDYPSGTKYKKSYPIHGIDYIHWENRRRMIFHDLGRGITIVSAFFGLVVAPLVSIDFKDKSFNLDTYKSWLIGGFSPLCFSIPLTLLSKPKEIKLRDHSNYDNPQWEVVK